MTIKTTIAKAAALKSSTLLLIFITLLSQLPFKLYAQNAAAISISDDEELPYGDGIDESGLMKLKFLITSKQIMDLIDEQEHAAIKTSEQSMDEIMTIYKDMNRQQREEAKESLGVVITKNKQVIPPFDIVPLGSGASNTMIQEYYKNFRKQNTVTIVNGQKNYNNDGSKGDAGLMKAIYKQMNQQQRNDIVTNTGQYVFMNTNGDVYLMPKE